MPREAAMDSQLMAVLAEYGRQHAQALRTEFIVFQPNEFSLKLVSVTPPGMYIEGWT